MYSEKCIVDGEREAIQSELVMLQKLNYVIEIKLLFSIFGNDQEKF